MGVTLMSIYNNRYYGVIFLPKRNLSKESHGFLNFNEDKVPDVQIFMFKKIAKQIKKTNKPARLVTCQLLKQYKGEKDILKVSYGIYDETYIKLEEPTFRIVDGSWFKGKTQLAKRFIEICEAQKHVINNNEKER